MFEADDSGVWAGVQRTMKGATGRRYPLNVQMGDLGVIPFAAERTMWPMPTFTVFDDARVHADSLDTAATLTQPNQVGLYARAFEHLSPSAVRGAAARGLITSALAALDL